MKLMMTMALCVMFGMQSMPARAQSAVEGRNVGQVTLRTSVDRVLADVKAETPTGLQTLRRVPRKDNARKQMSGGGSKTAAIITAVTSLVGVAGAIYMYKAISDQNDRQEPQQ